MAGDVKAMTQVASPPVSTAAKEISGDVATYFNPLLHTAVFRVYAEELSYARQHPLSVRRYMWKLEY